jgi:hypothetical protein
MNAQVETDSALGALARKLKLTTTCSVPLRTDSGIVPRSLPCTPHEDGLCVALVPTKDSFYLAVTHVRSGFSVDQRTDGSYPATKQGLAAAKRELSLLLPLADWTKESDALRDAAVDANVVVRRCRAAFPGKLVGGGGNPEAKPVADVLKWRVYVYDADLGSWTVVEIAHEDHLCDAVSHALTREGRRVGFVEDPRSLGEVDPRAYDFSRVLYSSALEDGRRTVVVEPHANAFKLCCTEIVELDAKITAAERELGRENCPRRTLGVWKSGPKLGQLRLSAKLSPEECIALLDQQERYDVEARKVEVLKADRRHLRLYIDTSKLVPQFVIDLRPAKTPDKKAAVDMLAFVQETRAKLQTGQRFFDKCITQLEANLRAYESVERHGFAPGTRCIVEARDEGEVDWLGTVADVHVDESRSWGEDVWWHERDIVDVLIGETMRVSVERLKAGES